MRVVQVNAVYGESSTGIIMRDIQRCSIDNGMDAHVAYSTSSIPRASIPNAYRIGWIIEKKAHAFFCRIRGRQAYFSLFSTLRFLRYLNHIQPDIVHLHNLHSNYINLNYLLRYLAKKDIATIITMHDCWYFTGGCFHYTSAGCNKWQNECGKCPKRFKDTPAFLCDASKRILLDRKKYLDAIPRLCFIGCSEWISQEAKKSIVRNRDIRSIYNGIDLNAFKPTPSNLVQRLGVEGKVILLGPANKWLSDVNRETLEYFIKKMDSRFVLVLFGARETERVISDNVILYGFTSSREELSKLYSIADVFVNCSREDTLSSLNLESQACGTPVVTYDATGNRETVNGICGFAVETGDSISLFQKVEEVVMKTKAYYSTACREWILKRFNKDINYKSYIDLYNSYVQ